jgi:hypothetical protein
MLRLASGKVLLSETVTKSSRRSEVSLERVADDLRALGGRDARAASGTVTATIRLPASS